MESALRTQAEILASHSTDIGAGDAVLIIAPHAAEDLVVALYDEIARRDATAMTVTKNPRFERAYLTATSEPALEPHLLSAIERSDVVITIRGATNTHETSDVDPTKRAAYESARQAIREARLASRWVTTQYPTPADAQAASMSTAEHRAFVWDATNRDWDEQGRQQQQLVDLLDAAADVRIATGNGTDLSMSVAGMRVVNDYGQHNMPGGEVSTAPVVESVEGTVVFDKPLVAQGHELRDVSLSFVDGVVTEYAAERNEDVLAAVLDTDAGARRIGELGIGMNRDITQFTYNMLFDEKMGDTVHLALGQAYEQTVGPAHVRNDSAIHMDMIVDMSDDSVIEFDGEPVQRDGTFVFEDGFQE
ncbi:Leucyl aminopeptidase (aminopeptidase T) [Halogranum rubrum]|uniref:Leucyl aminopeptidase (Aminopeptidase T) n=1 Tax=Halogranum rubrum TaxID=553466 RepID=A0A1I4GXT9_9EURY|nr:aminopeptidase [Halogranum rubrum]SFL34769.1 Leucyl aminopeptidase (aminopeptidase T) [Halogranum rubrum]